MLKHTYRSRTGANGICGVDVYEFIDRVTVMITELNRNPGISVTNCYHELATDIALGLMDAGVIEDPRSILWIEHYEGARSPRAPWNGETWDEVTMRWEGRRFRHRAGNPVRETVSSGPHWENPSAPTRSASSGPH